MKRFEAAVRVEGLSSTTILQKLLAEAVGTFMLTLTAMTVDILYFTDLSGSGHGVDYVSRWLARGCITAVAIYAFSETSGAHLDPAVTVGFALRRIFPWPLAGLYVIAQFLGAFAAAGILYIVFGPAIANGASHPSSQFTAVEAFIAEIILTAIVMLTILMTAQEQALVGKQAALAVGLSVAACGFFAGPISGASMNPARSIAPLLLSGNLELIWIYAIGPFAGAAIAVAIHAALCGKPTHHERKAARGKD